MHWMVDISGHLAVKTTEAQHFRRVVLQRAGAAADGHGAEAFAPGELYHWLSNRTAELTAGHDLPDRPARPPIDTNAGRGFAFIDHLGNVYPSGFLPLKAGNVREQDFTEIYRDAPIMRSLREPSGFGGAAASASSARSAVARARTRTPSPATRSPRTRPASTPRPPLSPCNAGLAPQQCPHIAAPVATPPHQMPYAVLRQPVSRRPAPTRRPPAAACGPRAGR